MALLDVTDVLYDPDFTSTYDLYSDASTLVNGLVVPGQTLTVGLVGVVQPASAKSLDLMPDGAKRSGAIDVWTTARLTVGDEQSDADEIVWHNSRYRVMNVVDWTDFGAGFVKATCQLEQVNFTARARVLPVPPSTVPAQPPSVDVGGGQIRYAEAAGSPPIQMAAGVRTLISFTIDPTQTQNYLNPPFAGVVEFDGTTITPYRTGDFYFILVNLLVTPNVSGGQILFDVDVGSPLGPTSTDTETMFGNAGVEQRVSGKLYTQDLTYFAKNGAKLYLTSSVPVSVINEAVLISPLST